MKEFIKKYKTDSKYKAKVQLIMYGIFIIFVSIFAISGTKNQNPVNNGNIETYNYQMNINLNDNIYSYSGKKDKEEITINKLVDDENISFSYKDGKYYRHENNTYVLTTEKEICDAIEFSYLSSNTINKYLSLSTISEDKNIVYLKDIIIGHNSDKYITIQKEENKYNIDYTSLMSLFDKNIEKLTVEIIIE